MNSWRHNKDKKQAGQIIVEYVLLLIFAVAVASMLTTVMINRNPESPGFLILKWRQIIDTIGADKVEVPSEEQ